MLDYTGETKGTKFHEHGQESELTFQNENLGSLILSHEYADLLMFI